MVTMEQLQAFMRKNAEEDSTQKYVNASGATLEEALREASVELSLPIKKIEYEVLEKGSRGVLGMGKRAVLILAYPARNVGAAAEEEGGFDADFGFDTEQAPQSDGQVVVRLTPNGVLLRVTAPVGDGAPVTERQAMTAISKRTQERVDTSMVARVVKNADGEWVRIGDYDYNPANDAYISCDIVDAEMRAVVTLSPPGHGGADPSADTILAVCQGAGVVFGFKEEVLEALENNPIYREPITVAEGRKPKNGADAKMVYNFRTDSRVVRVQESADGRADFKELNKIENVVQGQVLARKSLPEPGEPGQTVTGRMIPAKDGKDLDPPVGPNTRLSDDGRSILAETNGVVKLFAGKVTVEPVYVVNGDVNMKEGNIRFLGTVVIKGNVDDGFSVSAAGDIEVMGSVGRSELDAEGDIIVHQGINGKGDASVRAGRNLWSKFIENGKATAGDMIVVSDGIINSTIIAQQRIVCRGKRASIVGGHLRASEEIDAKSLGSVAGVETILEVGYDPKSKEQLLELEAQEADLLKQLEELQLNMAGIENMKKNSRTITPEKIKQYAVMKAKVERIAKMRIKIDNDRTAIQTYLDELKTNGRISASATVYQGVKIFIKDATLTIRNEMRAVTFLLDAGVVKVTRYEESRADISIKRREGHVDSTD